MRECPNCHDANKYGDYEGPTCEVCLGGGSIDDETESELEAEQIKTIHDALLKYASIASPYSVR